MEKIKIETGTYSVAEAAQRLGASRAHTYDLIREGAIPSLRFGNLIRVPKAPIERMVSGE
jgi:excisionase family DNA binding protein